MAVGLTPDTVGQFTVTVNLLPECFDHRRRKGSVVGGHHGECGARARNGGLGAEPPAGSRGRAPGQGVRGAKPPEAESILVIGCLTEPANLAPVRENTMFCYSPLVSELGGPECMVPPTPSLGGRCSPRPPGSAAYEWCTRASQIFS